MIFPAQFDSLENVALPPRPLHLAIGMFDGVHLGHQAVIESAIHSARQGGGLAPTASGLAGVLTFWPHPSRVLRPEEPVSLIMNPAMKARVLFGLGVDFVISQPFTMEFAGLEAEDFLPDLRKHLPGLAGVYVGENWRFGRGRRGNVELLIAEARKAGLPVTSAQRINRNGEPISSSRIRAALQAGDLEEANAMLGYTYFSDGVVVPGRRLGGQIGFHTLNVPWEAEMQPRHGVYTVRVFNGKSPARLPGVANFGLRPTVENRSEPLLEVHVIADCPFVAGDRVTVEWLKFLRPEQRFASVGELRAQIARDRDAAKEYFGRG